MARKLEKHPYTGSGNSLHIWYKAKNPLRVIYNFILIYAARILPSLTLKNIFYRLTGTKIGKGVSVGLMAMFDIFFPEMIEIGDNSIIGYNTTILGHEFLIKQWRTGKVRIGKNVLIGANCTILPGVTIGNNATISAMSLVNKDIPAGQTWEEFHAEKSQSRLNHNQHHWIHIWYILLSRSAHKNSTNSMVICN